MVLSTAWVTPLSSCRSSLRLQRSVDLNSSVFDSPALDQLLGVAVRAQVLVEEEVLDRLAEGAVVGDALVEVEVRVDDLLDHVLDLLVEGEPHVLARVHPRRGVERRVVVELLHHLAEGHAVLGAEVQPEALVQLGDDAGERLQLLRRDAVAAASCRRDRARPALRSSAILPLPVCWIRYDSMSMFCCTSRGSSSRSAGSSRRRCRAKT